MLELWKSRRARKAAVATIRPLVERTRFANGNISDDRWMDAYMVGFLTMLITLIAQRRVDTIGSEALGIVQADAWQEITGLPGQLVGEEACLLSANGHRDFMRGCHNAGKLESALTAQSGFHWFNSGNPDLDGTVETGGTRRMLDDTEIHALWSEYFERPLLSIAFPSSADRHEGWQH
ncbi:MAG: hypothetical protein K5905_30400 [Roseibium sp.]|uniref:hypothetical protein n=1 Tax=Roseibium sp. TaxID=1936156 RepID=UPI0026302175|nr:hypothetical protein [Roseibium sp.]MCV0429771.1 hypothetical protein [Roseibium sp.]